MDELQISKQTNDEWKFLWQDNCYYTGGIHQAKGSQILELKNSYGAVIITMTTMKSGGFHLFRANKNMNVEIRNEVHTGSLWIENNSYVWDAGAKYHFYVRNNHERLELVMCDNSNVLGYITENKIFMEKLMYSSILCAFWLWLNQRWVIKENIVYDELKVQQLLEKAI